jgi:hypothetical protein
MTGISTRITGRDGRQWSIATTTDDVKDREISAAQIHRVQPQRAHGGGAR